MHEKLSSRIIGYIVSFLLTLLAFSVVGLNFKQDTAILIILSLALVQFVVQSIFFLNLLDEKGPRWNLYVFLSTLSIILIVIVGSIWIMHHLNTKMMM